MRLVLLDATRSWLSPLSFCLGIIKANHRISIKDYYLVPEKFTEWLRCGGRVGRVLARFGVRSEFGARCGTLPR
jgi:hypothetical protein